jgi:ABC-2 type transport system permease protein
MSFYYLLLTNFRVLYRNWRGIFWNLFLPVAEYLALALLHVGNLIGGSIGAHYSQYLLPGMIAVSALQTGLFNTTYWIIDLKDRDILKRISVTPVSNAKFFISVVISRITVMMIQALLLVCIGMLFFGATVSGNIFWILTLIAMGGGSFIAIGILIASVSGSYDEAAPITTGINMIFIFLGNAFFPTYILPKTLQNIGAILPITFFADGLRNNFGMQQTYGSLFDLIVLSAWAILLGILCSYTFKKQS